MSARVSVVCQLTYGYLHLQLQPLSYQSKLRRHWFVHIFLLALTTVIRCCSVFLAAFFDVCRLYKTLLHTLLLTLNGVSTSRHLEETSLAAITTAY